VVERTWSWYEKGSFYSDRGTIYDNLVHVTMLEDVSNPTKFMLIGCIKPIKSSANQSKDQ